MASLVDNANNAFPRSHSSSNIPDFLSVEYKRGRPTIKAEELPRAASYTCLPVLESPTYSTHKETVRGFSTTVRPALTSKSGKTIHKQEENEKITGRATQEERPRLGRTKSLVARPKSWIQRAVKGSPERKDSMEHRISKETVPIPILKPNPDKPRNIPESFATFARKTWISNSRSPSPSSRIQKERHDVAGAENVSAAISFLSSSSPAKASIVGPQVEESAATLSANNPLKGLNRRFSLLHKKPKRPQSELVTGVVHLNSVNTSNSSLPGSLSDKENDAHWVTEARSFPRNFVKDKLTSLVIEPPRRKDELWSAFRSLELDFQKFQSKASALRANVVRSTLLPFLRNYAEHPSNKILRPEDIDKRVGILNKWWTGLLEMLDGRNNHYVTGIDRPVILDAITGVMTRPEWRLAPSYFAPVADRNSLRPLARQRSSSSLRSSASQFLAESVYHNVRNMFIQNLLAQISLVVDKMSLRNTPASLVTFCGKAAAYAFFFCPGVADILMRVWSVSSETIRRVVDEFGLLRAPSGSKSTDDIVSEFPPSLRDLGWKSSKALLAQLRQRLDLPLGASKIPWHGPWVARWCGRDSDLFFVFCKHYHILCEEFLPPGTPLAEKARAPGFVLVHAQILTAIEATIHRQPSGDATAAPLLTFDDVLVGADASAAALPLPPQAMLLV